MLLALALVQLTVMSGRYDAYSTHRQIMALVNRWVLRSACDCDLKNVMHAVGSTHGLCQLEGLLPA